MLLETIEVVDFRNLTGLLAFDKHLNVLVGDNGQGKTNWLEAIHLLSTTRSFRTARLQEAVRFGAEMAIIRGKVRESPEIARELQIAIQGNSKLVSVNGKKETTSRYLGNLHSVVFNANALEIVRGNPEARRRFLDDGIVALHPPFIQTFSDYNRVIRQKNSVLQRARDLELSIEQTSAELSPWNEQLVALAARIHRGRTRYVERLNEVLEKGLFGEEETTIRYVSSLEDRGDLSNYESLIDERLRFRVQAEVVAGHSLVGPHRDDLEISLDGHDIRRFGSAGQQRSALLLIQLADIEIYRSTRGEYPLFLLDDIDAELDYRRIGELLDHLSNKTQTVITTSKQNFVDEFGRHSRVFPVENGIAKSQ